MSPASWLGLESVCLAPKLFQRSCHLWRRPECHFLANCLFVSSLLSTISFFVTVCSLWARGEALTVNCCEMDWLKLDGLEAAHPCQCNTSTIPYTEHTASIALFFICKIYLCKCSFTHNPKYLEIFRFGRNSDFFMSSRGRNSGFSQKSKNNLTHHVVDGSGDRHFTVVFFPRLACEPSAHTKGPARKSVHSLSFVH